MKKNTEDAFCTSCEWTGDATGLTSCPVCGSALSVLDSLGEDDLLQEGEKEKYPSELIPRLDEDDDYAQQF